jgi:hypothetical protein
VDLLVAPHHREAPKCDVESGSLGRVIAFVVEVGLMDGLRDLPQHGVGELVHAKDRLNVQSPP